MQLNALALAAVLAAQARAGGARAPHPPAAPKTFAAGQLALPEQAQAPIAPTPRDAAQDAANPTLARLAGEVRSAEGSGAEPEPVLRSGFDGELLERGGEPVAVPQPSAAPERLAAAADQPRQRSEPPRRRGVKALTVAHAFGVFHDTAFKTLVSVWAASAFSQDKASLVIGLATALYTLPFVALSHWAGRLADRKDKRTVVAAVKLADLVLALLGVAALVFGSVPGALAVVTLFGVNAAVLSPAKYGLLAESVPKGQLARANGLFELSTFVALIGGTAAGGLMAGHGHPRVAAFAVFPLAASAALWAARLLSRSASPGPEALSPAAPVPRKLLVAMGGTAFFWFLSSILQMNLLLYADHALHAGPGLLTTLLMVLGLGTGLGSAGAGLASRDGVGLRLVPLGAAIVGLGMLALGLFPPATGLAFAALGFIGLSGGFFYVPLDAYVQRESPPDQRGRMIGRGNIIIFAAVMASGGVFWALRALGVEPLFTLLGSITVASSLFAAWLVRKARSGPSA